MVFKKADGFVAGHDPSQQPSPQLGQDGFVVNQTHMHPTAATAGPAADALAGVLGPLLMIVGAYKGRRRVGKAAIPEDPAKFIAASPMVPARPFNKKWLLGAGVTGAAVSAAGLADHIHRGQGVPILGGGTEDPMSRVGTEGMDLPVTAATEAGVRKLYTDRPADPAETAPPKAPANQSTGLMVAGAGGAAAGGLASLLYGKLKDKPSLQRDLLSALIGGGAGVGAKYLWNQHVASAKLCRTILEISVPWIPEADKQRLTIQMMGEDSTKR